MTKLDLEEFNELLFITILTALLQKENIKATVEDCWGIKCVDLLYVLLTRLKNENLMGFSGLS